MNNNPIVSNFASAEIPKFLEKKNKNLVFFGEDNLYPYELIDLYNDSSTHNAVINGKVGYIVGNGLESENVNVKKWLASANISEDWTCLLKRISLDYELFNGYAIEVVKTRAGNQYFHLDFANIRLGLDGSIKYAEDWITEKGTKNSKPTIREFERYNPRDEEQRRGVIYHVDYRPNLKHYPLPVYVGSLAEIRTDVQIGDYWLNEVENGFVGGTLIQHNNGVPETEEELRSFEKSFQGKFGKATGTKIVHLFSPSKENSSEISSLNGNDLHERYLEMSRRVKESIFIGHRVTNPILFGVKEEGQLGARNELDLAYEIFTNTYVSERQNTLLATIKKVALFDLGISDIEIKPLKPIDAIDLTSDIILANLDREEIRELITEQTGLELQEAIAEPSTPDAPIGDSGVQETQVAEIIDEEKEQKDASYNGAQIASALSIVEQVKNGVLSINQGKAALMEFLRLSEEVALKLLSGDEGFLNEFKEEACSEECYDKDCKKEDCDKYNSSEDFGAADKFETYNDYPKAASRNAKTALNYAEKNGWGSCGTPVGKKRANQLANGDNISRDTIARMAAFERHRKNSKKKLGDGCGRLMWLAWGGDEGIAWAQRKLKQIDSEKMCSCSKFSDDTDLSHLFENIGESLDNYEIVDKFDVKLGEDGSPIEFATEEQELERELLATIKANPGASMLTIAELLEISPEIALETLEVLETAELLSIEGTILNLTDVGERIAESIDVPTAVVRYKYSLRPDAPALKPGGQSRGFCQKMMSMNKVYSKQEIEFLRNDMKSSGISKNVTNVWLARGGWYTPQGQSTSLPYCRHIWEQVIVRRK